MKASSYQIKIKIKKRSRKGVFYGKHDPCIICCSDCVIPGFFDCFVHFFAEKEVSEIVAPLSYEYVWPSCGGRSFDVVVGSYEF
jgi:hypothetical protein